MEKIENIEHWYFPSPIPEQRTSDSQKQRALYFRNVVYLLQLHIKDKKDSDYPFMHLLYSQLLVCQRVCLQNTVCLICK